MIIFYNGETIFRVAFTFVLLCVVIIPQLIVNTFILWFVLKHESLAFI